MQRCHKRKSTYTKVKHFCTIRRVGEANPKTLSQPGRIEQAELGQYRGQGKRMGKEVGGRQSGMGGRKECTMSMQVGSGRQDQKPVVMPVPRLLGFALSISVA